MNFYNFFFGTREDDVTYGVSVKDGGATLIVFENREGKDPIDITPHQQLKINQKDKSIYSISDGRAVTA
jgi:hypothetical protein